MLKPCITGISNQKGGTAKTTTTVNLGAAIARKQKQVLLVDLDPQASLTDYFVGQDTVKVSIYDALVKKDVRVKAIELGDYVKLLPGHIDLAAAERDLNRERNREKRLLMLLERDFSDFDYILIDCPPSLGILTDNALTASRWAIVPVTCELMAERTVQLILDSIEVIKESRLNPDLEVWKILPTMFDQRLLHHKEILALLKDTHNGLVYEEPVKRTIKYVDAVTAKVDVAELDSIQGDYWDKLADDFMKDTGGK
jgi:chromosome partitioning protein